MEFIEAATSKFSILRVTLDQIIVPTLLSDLSAAELSIPDASQNPSASKEREL